MCLKAFFCQIQSHFYKQMNVLLEYLNMFDGLPCLNPPYFIFLRHFTVNLEASLKACCHFESHFTAPFPPLALLHSLFLKSTMLQRIAAVMRILLARRAEINRCI